MMEKSELSLGAMWNLQSAVYSPYSEIYNRLKSIENTEEMALKRLTLTKFLRAPSLHNLKSKHGKNHSLTQRIEC